MVRSLLLSKWYWVTFANLMIISIKLILRFNDIFWSSWCLTWNEYSVILTFFYDMNQMLTKTLLLPNFSWFQIYVYKLCMTMCIGITPSTTMLNWFSWTRIYMKIAFISHWNDLCLIPLGRCTSCRRATSRYQKFKFWNFWEHPLYEIWEYAFNNNILGCTCQWNKQLLLMLKSLLSWSNKILSFIYKLRLSKCYAWLLLHCQHFKLDISYWTLTI